MTFDVSKIDFDSFDKETETGGPGQNASSTMSEALKVNPAEKAKTLQLSKDSGVPEFAVESDPDSVEHGLMLDSIDFESMAENSPVTTKLISNNFDAAVIAQEDISAGLLESIEKTFKGLGESISLGFQQQEAGLRLSGADSIPETIDDFIPAGVLPLGIAGTAEEQILTGQLFTDLGVESDEQLKALKDSAVETTLAEIGDLQKRRQDITPDDLNIIQEGVRAGVESIANMAPGILLSAATGGRAAPVLMTMGAQTYTSAYADGRSEGLSPEQAQWFAGIDAAIEIATERLPTKTLERLVTGRTSGLTKGALKFTIQEMGTEQLATLGQTLNSFAFGLDEELENASSAQEILEIQLRRQAVTAVATVVAGGAQITAASGVRKAVAKLTQKEEQNVKQGEAEQDAIDRINNDATASELRTRDKETFKQFIRDADGNDSQVYLDGLQTSLYLRERTVEEIASDPALRALSNAAKEAQISGVDLAVPVADFAAEIAGTEHFSELREFMTLSQDTVAPFRREQHQEENRRYVESLMAQAQENESQYVEAQDIFDEVRDSLVDTGTLSPQNASVIAQVVPAWAAATAARTGRTVKQVYESAGLQIQGPQTGEQQRLSDEALTQAREVGFEGDSPSEADEWRRAVEKGLDVTEEARLERAESLGFNTGQVFYHGTDSQFTEFDTSTIGQNFTQSEDGGFFFTQRERTASSFGANVRPFLLKDKEILEIKKPETDPALDDPDFPLSQSYNPIDEYDKRRDDLLREARRQGKRGIKIEGFKNDDLVVIFNPSDIRSPDAAFNPEDRDSGDLLAQSALDSVPQSATIQETGEPDATSRQQPRSNRGEQQGQQQTTFEEATERSDSEALAQYQRAANGERVAFVHRSFDDFEAFDDDLLGANTDTPSARLGHYLSAADIGNNARYGNETSVHEFQLDNPMVISLEAFQSMENMTAEEVAARRESFIEMGHDGVLVDEVNWAVVFQADKISKVQQDASVLDDVFLQENSDQTQTEDFKEFSGNGEVVESQDINDYEFAENTPVVVKVFHGTTHDFNEFDATRGGQEGQFGAINYFTSSEFDAEQNYAGEGPDLTNRIEQRSEQLEFDIEDAANAENVDFLVEELGLDESTAEALVNEEINVSDAAKEVARKELSGGQDQVLELFVRLDNPFVIGENSKWIDLVDNDSIQEDAMQEVADSNGVSLEEVQENLEDFEDEIDEARWAIEADQENELVSAIQTVSGRYGVEAADLAAQVYDLGESAKPEDIENLLRSSDDYAFAEDQETGEIITSQLVAEVIQEMGFDSIILRDANSRFENMEMDQGTAHVHIFDSNKTNIKSVENKGTFDRTDPNIFNQKRDEARGYFDPANRLIGLTEAADLSTFLHEFAHFMYEMELQTDSDLKVSINNWFKRNAKDVSKEANGYLGSEFSSEKQGSEPPKGAEGSIDENDIGTFLDEGSTGDSAKDSAIRRATHEQMARGFEAYLMEGKAPSVELRNAFRTFARWLGQIYASIRQDLKVNLDSEIRQVFDRLLATKEQIEAAEARARFEPMFTDATMAGMTDTEFSDYKKRQQKVKDVQEETLRDKLIKQLTRGTKAWWKQEKQDLIDEKLLDLNNEKVYIARTRLKDGDIKLDHASVKEAMGVSKVDKIGRTSIRVPDELRGMTAKGQLGVHPDEAAALMGYTSGAELLNDLVNAPSIESVADTKAQEEMVARHGDILNDGTIEQQADEAVMSEARGDLILHELRTVARGTNQRVLERKFLKSVAEDKISELTFREIHPQKYRKAEINAAQESARKLAEGDVDGAARAKARQALNYYLGLAALEAKNETTKIVDRMARYNKKRVREEIMKAEGGYWDQIEKILNRFEFRKSATLSSVESKNQDINTWAKERMELDGDGLVLSNVVLNESYVTHWKNVTFKDLKGVSDSVKNIEHVARYANKLTRMGEEIDFNKLVSRLVDAAEETGVGRFKKSASIADQPNWASRKGRWFMAQMTKIPFMMTWMDGGERAGVWFNAISQPMTDAYSQELAMWKETGVPILEMLNSRSKADKKRHNSTIFIPEIQGTGGGTHSGNLKVHEIISVALNVGNPSNLKKLLLGEGWANPEVDSEISIDNPKLQAVLSHLTESDWKMVQRMWDQIDSLYPQLAEVHRRTTGLVPPKVEAQPVTTPFGEFKGGYYPVKYDPQRSNRAADYEARNDAEVDSMFGNNASIQASVNTGATNERTGYYAPIHLTLEVVPNHIQETIHYITHHDAVREINRLTRDARVRDAISSKLGPEEYAQIRPWLNDVAKDGRNAPIKTVVDAVFNRLRTGTTLGVMGFKASTGIIQISGLSNTIAEVGLSNVYQSMRSVLGSVGTMQSAWEFASENSKILKFRTDTMDREIRNVLQSIEGKRGKLAVIQEASMKHIALIQTYMVDLPSWHAAYIKGMKEWGDETRSFQYADWVVENVQGSGATKDMAALMRNQSKTHTIFTMFMTFFSALWNLERDTVKGARSGAYSRTTVAAKLMFLFTVPVIFEMLMRGEFSSDEDDDESNLQKMLTATTMYPIQSVPFVRDVANGLFSGYGYNASPVTSLMERGLQGVEGVSSAVIGDKELTLASAKNASKLAGAAFAIPGTAQAWATGEHIYDVLVEGEDITMRELLFGPEK